MLALGFTLRTIRKVPWVLLQGMESGLVQKSETHLELVQRLTFLDNTFCLQEPDASVTGEGTNTVSIYELYIPSNFSAADGFVSFYQCRILVSIQHLIHRRNVNFPQGAVTKAKRCLSKSVYIRYL